MLISSQLREAIMENNVALIEALKHLSFRIKKISEDEEIQKIIPMMIKQEMDEYSGKISNAIAMLNKNDVSEIANMFDNYFLITSHAISVFEKDLVTTKNRLDTLLQVKMPFKNKDQLLKILQYLRDNMQ